MWVFGGDNDTIARAHARTPRAGVGGSAAADPRVSAAAAASASASRSAAVAALPGQLDAILGGGGDTWSVATLDLATGAATQLGATSGMYTGSIVKVLILETLLRTQGGVAGLDSDEQSLADAMITQSDNDAATTLWDDAGGDDALDQTVSMLGLTDTQIDPDGWFGASTTSAADQIKVLQQLVSPTFLTAADVAYARGLMAQVESDQRWGAPTVADPGTVAENKNGWLNNDDDDGRWLVNTLGIETIGGQPYLIAVLAQHQPDFDSGVDALNQAVAAVAATLR